MKYLLLVISIITFASCTHRVQRINYNKQEAKACDISILKEKSFTNEEVVWIGTVKLGDTGFSTQCNEKQAIEILKREGCSLNADFIYIHEERRTDFASSCYRCTAQFFTYKDENKIAPKEEDNMSDLNHRVQMDKNTNRQNMVLGVIIGILSGMLTYSLF